MIDTGFNGDLMMTEQTARLFNLKFGLNASQVELGDGTKSDVYHTQTQLTWLGENRFVRIFVSQNWIARPDEPSALVGTGLLTPYVLEIDFGQSQLFIESR